MTGASIDRCPLPKARPVLKPILIDFGFLCVALGLIGVFTPGFPSTVFLIMAAWAFARSSKRYYNRLYGHKRFGPVLRDWHAHRVIPPKDVDRYSIALFVNTAFEPVCECLPTCTDPDNPPQHTPESYYDFYLWYMKNTYPHYGDFDNEFAGQR